MFNAMGFMDMADNYEERKVANFKKGKLTIDTCAVTDSNKPYETAVEHPNYNSGEWVITELYDTKEQAKLGHEKWVKTMQKKQLPSQIIDVSTAEVAKLCDDWTKDNWRKYKKVR